MTIYTMLSLAVAIAGHDVMHVVAPILGHAFWFATPENEWQSFFFRYLPRWLVVDGKIYTFGGRVGPNDGLQSVEEYDPVADKWFRKSDMPTGRRGAAAVVTPTGSVEAMESAFDITGRRARIVYFGLPADVAVVRIPALQTIFWDKTIKFSWLAPLTWPTALKAIETGLVDVSKLHSHTLKLEDLAKGIADVKARKGNVMKAIVEP